jgi:hypothetical protein
METQPARPRRAVRLFFRFVATFTSGTLLVLVGLASADQLETSGHGPRLPPLLATVGILIALLGGMAALSGLIWATSMPAARSGGLSAVWGVGIVVATVPLPLLVHAYESDGEVYLPLNLAWALLSGFAWAFCSVLVTRREPAMIVWAAMTIVLLNLGAPFFAALFVVVAILTGHGSFVF